MDESAIKMWMFVVLFQLSIIFQADPLCYSNSALPLNATIQKETHVGLWMRCTVNLVPDIEWRQYEGYEERYEKGRELTNMADTVIIPNSTITSELNVVLNSNATPLSYTFKMYFRPVNGNQLTNATNAPNYSYIWRIPVAVVEISPTYLQTALAVRPANIPDVAKSQHEIPTDPFYAEVTSIERATVKSEQRTPGSSVTESHDAQNSRPLNYFGDDGTEYMEVNAMGRQPMPVRLPTEPNMFNVVGEYAFIDHTLSPPIPPRGKIV